MTRVRVRVTIFIHLLYRPNIYIYIFVTKLNGLSYALDVTDGQDQIIY